MNLIVWNCQGGLHGKIDHLMDLRPDIAIVPEAAQPAVVASKRKGWPQ